MTFKITSLTVYTRSIIQSKRWELQPRWWHPSRITSKKATTEVSSIIIQGIATTKAQETTNE
jgi:hypothetical protein